MAGMPMESVDGIKVRIATCQACEYFKKPICVKCGCLIVFKARLATSTCPDGKW